VTQLGHASLSPSHPGEVEMIDASCSRVSSRLRDGPTMNSTAYSSTPAPATPLPGTIPDGRSVHTTPPTTVQAIRSWLGTKPVAILTICVISLSLRMAVFLTGPAHHLEYAFYGDSPRYVELAQNLLAFGTFGIAQETTGLIHIPLAQLRDDRGESEPRDVHGLRPEIVRTPGYPVFISAVLQSGLSLKWILVLQCLISTACVFLVYLIGKSLFGSRRVALIAAGIVAVHPVDLVSANAMMTETLFTFMMLAGLWVSVTFGRRSARGSGWGGLILGLSVLVRPVTLMLGPAVAMWMIATNPNRRTVWAAVVLTAASLIPAAGWVGRNTAVGFGPRISSIPYLSNFFYTGAYMHIHREGLDTYNDWPPTVGILFNELNARIQPNENVFDAMNRLTMEKIIASPLLYGKVIGHSMIKFMTDHSVNDLYKTLGWEYTPTGLRDQLLQGNWSLRGVNLAALGIAVGWMGWNLLLAISTLAGVIYLAITKQWTPLLLLGGVMVYFLITTQSLGLERFRVPVLGIQALLIASVFAVKNRRQTTA